jgi:hypothetical protein
MKITKKLSKSFRKVIALSLVACIATSVTLFQGINVSAAATANTAQYNFVSRLYTYGLGRNGSSSEIYSWANQIAQGKNNPAAVAEGIYFSAEGQKYSDTIPDTKYIQNLYLGVLGRNYDAGGYNHHLSSLTSAKKNLVNVFINSNEFASVSKKVVSNSTNTKTFVSLLYKYGLGRTGAASEIDWWANMIIKGSNTPKGVAQGILTSEEGTKKMQSITGRTFISNLYNGVLQRSPSESEISGHNVSLQNARRATLNAFLSSAEFANIKNSLSPAPTVPKIVSIAESKVGSTYAKRMCLAFVKECHKEAYNYDAGSACCAKKYADKYIDSTSMTNIPLGADVFFSGSSTTCSSCKSKCGHVGIYVGDGYIVHAWDGKIVKQKIAYIHNLNSYDYRGWGYHDNRQL